MDVTKGRSAFVFFDELTGLMYGDSPYPEFIEEGLDLPDSQGRLPRFGSVPTVPWPWDR